jgi:hypothetical protein
LANRYEGEKEEEEEETTLMRMYETYEEKRRRNDLIFNEICEAKRPMLLSELRGKKSYGDIHPG